MTKQEIYEQVVQLTSELHATNVAEEIFSAAKEGDPKKVEEVFETLKTENPDLYSRIVSFGEEFNSLNNDTIDVFGSEDDKANGAYIYDNNIINAVTFYALMLLAKMDEFYLFDWETESAANFVNAINETEYEELATFVTIGSIFDFIGEGEEYQNIYEGLVGIFKGDFK